MPDTTSVPSVPDAFSTLLDALAAKAMTDKAEFKRAAAYRDAVERLAERWQAGGPPHTVKTRKAESPAADIPVSEEG